MAREVFVIGIGGTGMRCIESFIHLCAIGMFDDTEVNMLALDTDKDNGNFTRLKNLKEAYRKTKGYNKPQEALKDTFFSAKLNYYQFSPDYSRQSTFVDLFDYGTLNYNDPDKAAVADLLLTQNAREFDLKHGYRAQTHLGSMLMYHSIVDEIRQGNTNSDLRRFIQKLIDASSSHPRVFILGSVFGGTGASSIPIIPKAIRDAANLMSDATDIEKNAYFGATLLTAYFSFSAPTPDELAKQKVIATSDKFALNSQAAMMFYESDKTVEKTYQRLYMMGTDGISWRPGKVQDKVETGGEKQENDSHYIELLAAFAAWHFFNSQETGAVDNLLGLEDLKIENKLEYVYRTFDDNGKIDFKDFVGDKEKAFFAQRLGLFTAMTLLEYNERFFEQAQAGELKVNKIEGYEDIDKSEIDALHDYMRLFHFKDAGGVIQDGWLRQLHRSAGGGDKFLLSPYIFSATSPKEFSKMSYNKELYQKGSDFEKNAFSTGLISNIINEFRKMFIKKSDSQEITNKNEKLIKRVYDTLCSLYQFN